MGWQTTLVMTGAPIVEAMRALDKGEYGVVCVVDTDNKLLGTVTDGDVRRGLLRGIGMNEPIDRVMNDHPISAAPETTPTQIAKLMSDYGVKQIPLISPAGKIVGVEIDSELKQRRAHNSPVLIMAGGLGKRLWPLTENCPKPLLRVGKKPVLEVILERFIASGFRRFYFSVNYKAEMIMEHFGDGSSWDVEIEYLRETKTLGTAGALSLLPQTIQHPVIVMNGDLLTKVDFNHLLDFHCQHNAFATMCVREYEFQFPYGVVSVAGHTIESIKEKPLHRVFVNAGIYVFQPDAFRLVPSDQPFNMDALFHKMMAEGHAPSAFPLREYWLDIGQMDDFRRAEFDFDVEFSES